VSLNEPPKPKAPPLYCDTCHTKWDEFCFRAWSACPFKDCRGTLTPPTMPVTIRKAREKHDFPLFGGLERPAAVREEKGRGKATRDGTPRGSQ
jgi:hypothetical protein